MPKYTYKVEKLKAEQVSKNLLENGLNAAAVARQRGTSRQNEAKKARRKPVQDCLQKFLTSKELKKTLIEVAISGMKATRLSCAKLLIKTDGEVERAEDVGAIETTDYNAQHKFWHDLMVGSGALKINGNGKNGNAVAQVVIKIEGADGNKIQSSQAQSVASFQR